MEFHLPYGWERLTFRLPDFMQAVLISPEEIQAVEDPVKAVNDALDNPIGGVRLSDFAGARSAAVAISDKTRPVPHEVLLPPLLKRLEMLGISPEAITLLIATGTHPIMSPDEFPVVVPSNLLARFRVICHDADGEENLINLGKTKRGTPVWINRHFVQADLRLVVGNIEPHQFMGFSGGVKPAVIGLAGKKTINFNHTMMIDPLSRLGCYENNPARQDVEEIGKIVKIHFALNTILNESSEIAAVVAGEPGAVMRKGVPLVRKMYQVTVHEPFDLVIASPGGYPKDINLYQSQKGLAHAGMITRDGGAVILAAACPEGTGSEKYEQWMEGKTSCQAVFKQFKKEGFRIGPHKAFQIARDVSRLRVFLISEMPPDYVSRLLLTPSDSIDHALARIIPLLPPDAKAAVLPKAASIIPDIQQNMGNELKS